MPVKSPTKPFASATYEVKRGSESSVEGVALLMGEARPQADREVD
jgi:hypothetical protein